MATKQAFDWAALKPKIFSAKLTDLNPYENNPRINQKAIPYVQRSIKRFGFIVPIVVDSAQTLVIAAGHTRHAAALKLCQEEGKDPSSVEVLCLSAEHLTPSQVRQFRLADNRVATFSQDDADKLRAELKDLVADWDAGDFGFEEKDFEAFDFEEEGTEEDVEIEVPAEAISKRGVCYQLGKHRLMCGDSTSKDDIEKLMQGEKCDLVFTDPPYLLETKGGCKDEVGKVLKKQGESIEFIADFDPRKFLNVLPSVFKNGVMNAYIFCNKELLPSYLNYAVENGLAFNVLIWKKPNALPIGDSHRPDIEYLLFFRKKAIWNNGLKGINYSRCLEFSRETGLHPTMKPVGLVSNEIAISSKRDSIVVDFFGGSGSTIIACEVVGRRGRAIEIDPKYVDVIRKRWAEKVYGAGCDWENKTPAIDDGQE